MTNLTLIIVLHCFFVTGVTASTVYHIVPTESAPCPAEFCLTLSQFNASPNKYLQVDTTLFLLPGNHVLESDLAISSVAKFQMLSITLDNVNITCEQSARIIFHDSKEVNVSGIKFLGCVENSVKFVEKFELRDSSFIGQENVNGTALHIVESSANLIRNTFAYNRGSKSHSVRCNDTAGGYRRRKVYYKYVTVKAGGAIVSNRSKILITHSKFERNSAQVGGVIFSKCQSHITILDSIFENNHATPVGSMHGDCELCLTGGGVVHIENDCSLTLEHSKFFTNRAQYFGSTIDALHAENAAITIDNCTFDSNKAKYGGVVNVFGTYRTVITITSSEFRNNQAEKDGAVVALLSNIYLWSAYDINMNITGSNFSENSAQNDGGVFAISNTENTLVSITDCDFISNSAENGGGVVSAGHNENINITISEGVFEHNKAKKGGAIMFYEMFRHNHVMIERCDFQNNSAHFRGGVLYSEDQNLTITVDESYLINNMAEYGGAAYLDHSRLTVKNSTFTDNSVTQDGGAAYLDHSRLTVKNSRFIGNSATQDGGAFCSINSRIRINTETKFESNSVGGNGGTMCLDDGVIMILNVSFKNNYGTNGGVFFIQRTKTIIAQACFNENKARGSGGVMYSKGNMVMIIKSTIQNNSADTDGGAILLHQSRLLISKSNLLTNRAESRGGVLNVDQSSVKLDNVTLKGNSANLGGVIWADHATIDSYSVDITDNRANSSVVYLMESTLNLTSVEFSSNNGSLCSIESSLILTDVNMTEMKTGAIQGIKKSQQLEEGGAITAFQGTIRFYGNVLLANNCAQTGGAIRATEVKAYFEGNVTVANNVATQNGGGIFLRQSELTCRGNSTLMLLNNTASEEGGGVHAIGSSIKVNGTLVESGVEATCASLHFIENKAKMGGGLCLQMDAKLYILKSKAYTEECEVVMFTANSADFGGAVYVSDDGICTSTIDKECFFQSLALYRSNPLSTGSVHQSIQCSNNTATTAGNTLYGGLLDTCTINPLVEPDVIRIQQDIDDFNNESTVTEGLDYLQMISNIQDSDIQSPPVRVCFCREGQPDCSFQHDPVYIKKGQLEKVSLSLAVLDQVNRPVTSATIYNRLASGTDLCQHHIQMTDGNCSKIDFAAFSNNETEELILFTDGPCKDTVDCQSRVKLMAYCPHCPIGFELTQDEEDGCRCDCDSKLSPFISECSAKEETFKRKKNCWISNININNSTNEKEYLIYPHCPLDYCHPLRSKIEINLNLLNGSDAQCANNRSGLLCGTCKSGFSLSLGSSRCISCSNLWPVKLAAILVAGLLAGIFLVVFLLVLNLTVAIGTLNGIIFYANIVAASSNTFFPFSSPNFVTVFISWLNLEIGFDVCFFDGLNSFWKTLLGIVFPGYIILLVILIIIVSEASSRFAKLIGKRNPVATLATLVLLSYAKILHSIIASLSFARLNYPDGSTRMVWLPNASVDYLQGKHIALFVIAILILLVGLIYTVFLFSWQWLLRHKINKLFKRKRFQKLCLFIEPYHAPYTFRHRYWTGMLLLVRVFLYIISAINLLGDPRVTLVAIIFVVTTLLLVKGTLAKNLYKRQPVDIIETTMYFNLVLFATLTLFNFDMNMNQEAVAYTSVSVTFVLFVTIIAFHVYRYTALCSLIQKTKLYSVLDAKLRVFYDNGESTEDSTLDDMDAEDNRPRHLRPTRTVVEIHNLDAPTD